MLKRFYLVRHGDKVKTPGDPPLSEKGESQAKQTAKHFKKFPIHQILASPILRTQQTAKFISDELNLNYETNDLLRERVNWGDAPNQSFDDFISAWERSTANRDWTPPSGDSSRAAGERIRQLIESHAGDASEIILVAHGGVITDFLLNIFPSNKLNAAFPNFSNTKESNVLECSLTIVDFDTESKSYNLELLADTSHLT